MVMSTQQESGPGPDALNPDGQAPEALALEIDLDASLIVSAEPDAAADQAVGFDQPSHDAPFAEPEPALELTIPVAEEAPLVPVQQPSSQQQSLGLPLQLLNQLLATLGKTRLRTLVDLLPALRVLALLLLAGITLKLTGATLGAINDIPMMGRLLELVGLISALNFLARNALKSQQRAELMGRILKLKREYFG